jgi:hypothetical protein
VIFGRTDKQREALQQAKMRKLILGVRRFRVLIQLADGRWVFCHNVWEYHYGGVNDDGSLFLWSAGRDTFVPRVTRYLTPSDDHVNVTVKDRNMWTRANVEVLL